MTRQKTPTPRPHPLAQQRALELAGGARDRLLTLPSGAVLVNPSPAVRRLAARGRLR